jgi:hypothetical protein
MVVFYPNYHLVIIVRKFDAALQKQSPQWSPPQQCIPWYFPPLADNTKGSEIDTSAGKKQRHIGQPRKNILKEKKNSTKNN